MSLYQTNGKNDTAHLSRMIKKRKTLTTLIWVYHQTYVVRFTYPLCVIHGTSKEAPLRIYCRPRSS
jgi:hypothetical protein